MTTFHVAVDGSDLAPGTAERPFRTISRGARAAMPGDTVRVHGGEYREWVVPRRGGIGERRRIVYEAAPGEHVVIKGSEPITGWQPEQGSTWRVEVPNTLFGDVNPYAETINGDWVSPETNDGPPRHLGEVYLDGMSFFEAGSVEELADPPLRTTVTDHWTGLEDRVREPEQTRHLWFAEVGEESTVIRANFQGADPNTRLVEINVRRSVFYPREHHLDYITVRGFEMAHAATPWTPPTADQPGLIGPNWAKGWIIEDNHIHDSKCSGISLGKEGSTGHNFSAERGDKPGYQYQLESVFSARQIGWDAEHVGGHIVRRNHIHDCGQNGVVGHLGAVFSTIEHNHIHRIALKREFYGWEIAGIKLHAAIDVVIRGNHIHDCSSATWLDWQAQGTRFTGNVLHDNNRDLFVEVSHGPYLVDNNVLASPVSLEVFSQGGAYVNNLVCGLLRTEPVLDRPTPYHVPRSTQVAGYGAIVGGDDRFVANLFLSGPQGYRENPAGIASTGYGTSVYEGKPTSLDAYRARVKAAPVGDQEPFLAVPQPLYARHNVYGSGRPHTPRSRPSPCSTARRRRGSSRTATPYSSSRACRRPSTRRAAP
ncbi:right-handed parallel beta-helix repeat-containing protein [Tessaracoccus aquimaris]|uniref:right-handed parallel beta-helix repeat-containing protein n=1 Tax=Tessaracoccus aquimaris TaxID=1332264 RepID=UPI001D048E8E|nr:right-handed parallel beta-helix repeat-containing protein [Tessaracoccus aquimaris]